MAAFSASPTGQSMFVEQADGSVYGFGLDTSSQLGNDGTTNATSPTVVLNLAPVTTMQASTYTYSGDGNRISVATPAGLAEFAWDTTSSIPEVLSDGTYSYLYGPSGEVVEQVSQGGTATFLVQDQLGSTRLLVNSSGSVVGSYAYDTYGAVAGEAGSSSSAIGFAGGYEDSSTGLIYLIHRYYDPMTAEFVSVDPLVSQTGQAYTYSASDSVNVTDPSGEISQQGPTGTAVDCGQDTYTWDYWDGDEEEYPVILAQACLYETSKGGIFVQFNIDGATYPAFYYWDGNINVSIKYKRKDGNTPFNGTTPVVQTPETSTINQNETSPVDRNPKTGWYYVIFWIHDYTEDVNKGTYNGYPGYFSYWI